MDLVSIRVITDDIRRLVQFYEQVTGLSATWFTEDFAELATPSSTLAIGSKRTMEMFGSGAARPADNHTAIIEFVQRPTTMPWGNRSLLFRDPDGNLINFFTRVTPDAITKFDHHPQR